MSVIYLLLTISFVVAVIFFIVFIVSVKSGQYDDTYTPSVRMLFEDELVNSVPSAEKKIKPSLPAERQVCDLDSYRGKQTVESALNANRLPNCSGNDEHETKSN